MIHFWRIFSDFCLKSFDRKEFIRFSLVWFILIHFLSFVGLIIIIHCWLLSNFHLAIQFNGWYPRIHFRFHYLFKNSYCQQYKDSMEQWIEMILLFINNVTSTLMIFEPKNRMFFVVPVVFVAKKVLFQKRMKNE